MAVRLKKRSDVASITLITITMMCLHEHEEVVLPDTSIDIFFRDNECCTVFLKMTMKYGTNIVHVCEKLQKHIKEEIEAMTNFTVDCVNIAVQNLVYRKNA
ncbi:cell envelope-related Asp23 family protein [Anoxybacillus vitaminiphilus]|uniref:Cell envelope-related Asp23 family protein n=1 Tax=Paranoxybacillus vitaminiphilus TaxID=581036 RepID=A0A327YSD3_9BACL|nr:Asp23/Gls24 family envelope stress response protein [Anoxybacillus vitaminiphilus]RAK23236.1 cell envelope-related Asp23 family protein [Anoxybacillus vitaminiphilus]